jgi:hypothetical protein
MNLPSGSTLFIPYYGAMFQRGAFLGFGFKTFSIFPARKRFV